MTHPDIITMERQGSLYPLPDPEYIGVCERCGAALYDNGLEWVESRDGKFCDMECCCEYYEIIRT